MADITGKIINEENPAAFKPVQPGLPQIPASSCGGAAKKPVFIFLAVELEKRNFGPSVSEKNGLTSGLGSQDLFRLTKPPAEASDENHGTLKKEDQAGKKKSDPLFFTAKSLPKTPIPGR
ncbi:MAG: hypothetical protein LBP22_01525 [Deltaproteobacteria bacterium]|nr:hypothetical protein [Deltaproteobacteria bacterium]